jgi:hypothetical protein
MVWCLGVASLSVAQAPTGSFVMKITATCPSGTSATATPPTCFLPDAYRIEELTGTSTWTKVVILSPPAGSSVVPTTHTLPNQPIPTTKTFRVIPMLYGTDGKASPSVIATIGATNVNAVLGITVTVP